MLKANKTRISMMSMMILSDHKIESQGEERNETKKETRKLKLFISSLLSILCSRRSYSKYLSRPVQQKVQVAIW
ncbi:MAG: hypothetical protein M3288_07395, partial [Thermoproteota archaeon]|nr:hypothetical protein [Thermoproteota archaeon]